MVRADFRGTLAKLERAEKHLGDLENEVRIYIESEPITLDSKPNADGTSEDFYFRYDRPIPEQLDLILGDCIHNLRSALDHIAMSLAIVHGVDPYDSSVSFPICKSHEDFFGVGRDGSFETSPMERTGRFNVRKLSIDAQEFIEEMQPYHKPNEAWPLIELQYLDNQDKHRGLLEHAFNQKFQFELNHPDITLVYADSGRVEDGAFFATVQYADGYSGAKVKPPLTAGISVRRSNRIGILFIPTFITDSLLDRIKGIWSEAERRFGAWSELT